jgi:mono/diheme cytochrome c family protein
MRAVVLALVALVATDERSSSSVVAHGERLVAATCGACHAVHRDDASPMAAAPPLRTLFGTYPPAYLAEALAEGIVVGHAVMPEFRFGPGEIDAVLAYLDRLTSPVPRRRPRERGPGR